MNIFKLIMKSDEILQKNKRLEDDYKNNKKFKIKVHQINHQMIWI